MEGEEGAYHDQADPATNSGGEEDDHLQQ